MITMIAALLAGLAALAGIGVVLRDFDRADQDSVANQEGTGARHVERRQYEAPNQIRGWRPGK